jgi:hypothetical protein
LTGSRPAVRSGLVAGSLLAVLGTGWAQVSPWSRAAQRPGSAFADSDSVADLRVAVAAPVDSCRLPAVLHLASDVRDPAFAILLGLLETDACGMLTRARMEREVSRSGRSTQLPVHDLMALWRQVLVKGKRARVGLDSIGPIDLPVPYKILIYNPGKVRGSENLEFAEWNLGRIEVAGTAAGGANASPIVLEDVHLWGITQGKIGLDVDGWVDKLLGSRLDDMDLTGIAFLRWRGEWVGIAMGRNPRGLARSGVFRFRDDQILFPPPEPLKAAA